MTFQDWTSFPFNGKEDLEFFVNSTALPVPETGLWLHERGILGASPDGLVGQNHVLEIKCPYTERNELIVNAVKNESFCLKINKDGCYNLLYPTGKYPLDKGINMIKE